MTVSSRKIHDPIVNRPASFDAIGPLELADIACDLGDLRRGDGGLRRHVAETPVVRGHASSDGELEGDVGVVSGLVDAVDQRRSRRAAVGVLPVAPGAVEVECAFLGLRLGRQVRDPNQAAPPVPVATTRKPAPPRPYGRPRGGRPGRADASPNPPPRPDRLPIDTTAVTRSMLPAHRVAGRDLPSPVRRCRLAMRQHGLPRGPMASRTVGRSDSTGAAILFTNS